MDIADGAVRRFLENAEEWKEKARALPERPRPGRILSQAGETLPVARGLVARGVLGFVEEGDALGESDEGDSEIAHAGTLAYGHGRAALELHHVEQRFVVVRAHVIDLPCVDMDSQPRW